MMNDKRSAFWKRFCLAANGVEGVHRGALGLRRDFLEGVRVARGMVWGMVLVAGCFFPRGGWAAEEGWRPPPLPENIDFVWVKTKARINARVPFFVRKPPQYMAGERGGRRRVLLIVQYLGGFGNGIVLGEQGCKELVDLADKRGWFVVSPIFRGMGGEVMDRTKSYYYPEAYSGQAVVDALELIAKKYPINTDQVFGAGLSGGAQFMHRFANAVPDRMLAVAVNSSSWFDAPNARGRGVAWLVTVGEADANVVASLDFVDQLRDVGALPIYRSYLGMGHGYDPRVAALNVAFFTYWDERTKGALDRPRTAAEKAAGVAMRPEDLPFVGDAVEWTYVPNTVENRAEIPEDARVYFPTEKLAKLWSENTEAAEHDGPAAIP